MLPLLKQLTRYWSELIGQTRYVTNKHSHAVRIALIAPLMLLPPTEHEPDVINNKKASETKEIVKMGIPIYQDVVYAYNHVYANMKKIMIYITHNIKALGLKATI